MVLREPETDSAAPTGRPAPPVTPTSPAVAPRPTRRYDLAFYPLLAAAIALMLAPLWLVDVLPLVDVGSHLHLIRLLHDFDHSALVQHHYVRVHAIVPYLSYYQLVDWLAWLRPAGWFQPLTDVEWANKVVLSVCLLALPLSALSLVRAAGHCRWLVFGIVPWMLNADFFMGFLNYLMSIPMFLWLLATHLRFLQRPGWGRALVIAGWLALLAMTHYLLWAVSLALLPTIALLYGWRHGWQRGLWWPVREVLLGLPSIGLLAPWFVTYFVFGEGVGTSGQGGMRNLFARLGQIYAGEHLGPLDNLEQLGAKMFDSLGAPEAPQHLLQRPGELVTVLWVVGLLLWILGSVRGHGVQPGSPAGEAPASAAPERRPSQRQRWWQRPTHVSGTSYTGWALALVLVAYFVLPQHLLRPIWLWGVNFRLVEVIGVLAVVALPVRVLQPPRLVRLRVWAGLAAMAACTLLFSLVTARAFVLARTEYGPVREAFAAVPPGGSMLTLRRAFWGKHLRFNIFHGVTEFYALLRGGYVPYSFADTSSKPLVVNGAASKPAPPWNMAELFTWRDHGRYYDYLALFGTPGAEPEPYEAELPKDLKPLYQRGPWRIYRNPRPEEYPPPAPEVLAERATVHAQRLTHAELVAAALRSAGLPTAPRDFVDEAMLPIYALPWGVARPEVVAPLGWPIARPALGVRPPPVDEYVPTARPLHRLPRGLRLGEPRRRAVPPPVPLMRPIHRP